MSRVKFIAAVIALVLAAGAFYYANYAPKWQPSFELPKIEKEASGAISRLPVKKPEKEVSAPPPLRVEKKTEESVLTKAGTIEWTNTQRVKNGLPPLSENSKLSAAALVKAIDMFDNQYFEHVSPSGVGPADLAKSLTYEYIMVGENLALGNFKNDEDLVLAWMASPGHRANILNNRFTEIGVAVKKGVYEGETVWLAVQEFGMPSSVCPEPDKNLSLQINSYETELSQLEAKLAAEKQEIENLGLGDKEELNQKVGLYNSLVNQYNNLIETLKTLISQYNVEVQRFNDCTTG